VPLHDALPILEKFELPAGKGELVLVADDERSIRELARAILETYGYRTLIAADAAHALKLGREHGPEVRLALIDVRLPDMDSVVCVRTLREQHPGLRVLLTSAAGQGAAALQALGLGEEAHVIKPFTAPRLLKCVQR